jgi:Ca2+-binding RTX toxin-like protein
VSGSSTLPDQIYGTGGIDNLSGNGGDDIIIAREGNDFLSGGDGNDTLMGGGGDDILNGGTGSDTFVWLDGNQSTVPGSPAEDTIQDFEAGDVLDLQDLLNGDLSNYLDVTLDGSDITIHVTDGTNNSSANDVQTIVLVGYTTSDSTNDILAELIANQTYLGKI